MISAVIGNEACDVVNKVLGDMGCLGSGGEYGGRSCRRLERLDCIGQFLLKPEQFGCRFHQDVGNAKGLVTDLRVTYVVVLERRQLEIGWIRLGNHFVGCCIHYREVRCFDEPLQHGDVRRMHAAQRETLRIILEDLGKGIGSCIEALTEAAKAAPSAPAAICSKPPPKQLGKPISTPHLHAPIKFKMMMVRPQRFELSTRH